MRVPGAVGGAVQAKHVSHFQSRPLLVRSIAEGYGIAPDQLSAEQVQDYVG
jgi:hypothetical protein